MCLRYITYDPNYNYDNDGEEEGGETMETEEGEEEDEEYDEYSDDDDMSWKVRRAAAKCLEAVISSRHELLASFYRTVSPALIARFKEREENVKSDIFQAYVALLRQTRGAPGSLGAQPPDQMDQGEMNAAAALQAQVPQIVRALHTQLKDKSIKTRQDCFNLLKELVGVLPGAMASHMPVVVSAVEYSMG